jgi:PAS domain S-box-containing protein
LQDPHSTLLHHLRELVDRVAEGDTSARLERSSDPALEPIIDTINEVLEHHERIEAALRQSEGRFRQVVNETPVGISIYDASGQCVFANASIARTVGATRDRMLAQNYNAVESWKRSGLLATVRKTAKERISLHREVVTVSSFDKQLFLDCHCVPLGSDHVIVMAQDVSGRKGTELALAESESVLRKSQKLANLGSYILDVESGKWSATETLDDIFGIPSSYPRTVESWVEILSPEDREPMTEYFLNHVLKGRNRFDREYRIVRPSDGEERWVFGMGELEFDDDGRPITMIGTIQDITERKQAEQERARLESQLFQAQKMETIGRLAGGVAHDFNNMLGVILGCAQLAKGELEPGDPVLADLEDIEEAAIRSREITRQLLAFSRKEVIAPRVLDLNSVVGEMQGALGRLIGEDISLEFHPAPDLMPVVFDESQLHQILVNLGANARDAMPNGGSLTIETTNADVDESCSKQLETEPGPYALMAVSDSGVGMDPETIQHIFEPFYTTKGRAKGTGLGLATVYGIMRQNHGSVQVRSEPGEGTAFQLYFPLAGAVEPENVVEPPTPRPGSGTILLVEDDSMVSRMTDSLLRGLGYSVIVTSKADDAVSICERGEVPIRLVLTDVVMPGMSGAELRDRLAVMRPELPVLFMSGYTADVIVQHGVLENGTHLLQKPFTQRDLAIKLEEALSNLPPAS